MKTLSLVVLLVASLAFVVLGCSDNSAGPVSPADQSSQAPASLEKRDVTNFTMSHQPIAPLPLPYPANPAIRLVPGGIWHLKDVEVHEGVLIEYENGTEETGEMIHYLSSTMDAAGEGPVHGSFTMTLESGGVWKGTYQGYRSIALPPPVPGFIFELPLKVVAHGVGGNIDGMKLTMIDVIRARGVPPNAWFGGGNGSFK